MFSDYYPQTEKFFEGQRLAALASLVNSHSSLNKGYAGDIVYIAASLATDERPCCILIRESGYEYTTDPKTLDSYLHSAAFGDSKNGRQQWYTGAIVWEEKTTDGRTWYEGDPKLYTYVFTPANGDECRAHLNTAAWEAARKSAPLMDAARALLARA